MRQLNTMSELYATVDLQKRVWGIQDLEVASPHSMRAIVDNGGAVFGAELGGRMVGMSLGFAAPRDGELWLWSHMTGVDPACQSQGVGFRLKQAQRRWALEQGYRVIAWTFDPLQSGNANFNFNRLGVTASHYTLHHYGEMRDGINAGLASDRLEAQWRLDSPKVAALAAGDKVAGGELPDGLTMLLSHSRGELRARKAQAGDGQIYGVEIPANIADLKRRDINKARQWQLHLREALTGLLADGCLVSDFVRDGGRAWYLLRPQKL